MSTKQDPLDQLTEIKHMMERSSRFISLSGLSGVAAGCAGLIGAYLVYRLLGSHNVSIYNADQIETRQMIFTQLSVIAAGTLTAAILSGLFLTFRKARRLQQPMWNFAAKRLIIQLFIPLGAGGLLILKMLDLGYIGLIAPTCLLIYGLALMHASTFTLGDIRYLGYTELVLGLINLLFIESGLLFWTLGFGVAHILYGILLWNKYDRIPQATK